MAAAPPPAAPDPPQFDRRWVEPGQPDEVVTPPRGCCQAGLPTTLLAPVARAVVCLLVGPGAPVLINMFAAGHRYWRERCQRGARIWHHRPAPAHPARSAAALRPAPNRPDGAPQDRS